MRRLRRDLLQIYAAALAAVEGRVLVRDWLGARPQGDLAVIALGKAADSMLAGALQAGGSRVRVALAVGKGPSQVAFPAGVRYLASAHPLPDRRSLAAGEALLSFLRELPPGLPLLWLISGGASSLVEVPVAGVDASRLAEANRWLLASGLDIAQVNAVRRRLSAIKGGGLLDWLGERPSRALYLSDVAGDDPAVIASGMLIDSPPPALPAGLPDWLTALLVPADPGQPRGPRPTVSHSILANCETALVAAAAKASALGYAVWQRGGLDGPAEPAGRRIADSLLRAEPGVMLWGGETTVMLPALPGRGGRNQQLALAAAMVLAGHPGVALLAAGTDGSDGPTEDAGGLVDGGTLARAAEAGFDGGQALRRADAGSLLEASGDLVSTGPTGSNVRDLVIGIKSADD